MSTIETIKRGLEHIANECLLEMNSDLVRRRFAEGVKFWMEEMPVKDVRVVCDELNNTMDLIDRGGFNADIFVTPHETLKEVHLQLEVRRVPQQFVGEFVCDVVKG